MALIDILSFDGVGIATAKNVGSVWGRAEKDHLVRVETDVPVADVCYKHRLNRGRLELLPEDEWRSAIEERRIVVAELQSLVDYERKKRQIEDDTANEAIDKAVLNVYTGIQIPGASAAELSQKLFVRTRTPAQMAEIEAMFKAKLDGLVN